MAQSLATPEHLRSYKTSQNCASHLPRPGWRKEGLALPTGQGTLPSHRTAWGGRRVSGGVEGKWEEEVEVEILNGIVYKAIKIKKKKTVHHAEQVGKCKSR